MEKISSVKTYNESKPIKSVQARYKRKLDFCTLPKKSQIFKSVKRFEARKISEDHRVSVFFTILASVHPGEMFTGYQQLYSLHLTVPPSGP